ncbi:MAG: LPS export ABC transporter permease LptF [Candidatus Competibacteraceae bacterium]|nr:LPS export ABC transporter permease LptF [Candidatus Competibacteraceae bacterium]
MPSIIDRYLIREIGLTLLATVLVLLLIVFSHRLAGYLNKAANGLLARDSIFLLLSLQLIEVLIFLMPLAFLLSIMLTLGRLYRDHEMTALAACGQGPLSVYHAVFLLAMPVALLTASLALFIAPMTMEWQFEVLNRARKEAEISIFTPGTFREVLEGRHVVYIGALEEHELRDVFIQTREANGELSITTGKRGRQDTNAQGIRYLVLEHGYRYRGAPGRSDYSLLSFEQARVRIDAQSPTEAWRHRETLPTKQLLNSREPGHVAELQMRLNSPIQLLLIALWAPLLARAHPREGRYGRIVAAMLIYTIHFNLVGVGESWLTHSVVDRRLGLWWVHGIFLLFGLGLWLHYQYGAHALRRLPRLLRRTGGS